MEGAPVVSTVSYSAAVLIECIAAPRLRMYSCCVAWCLVLVGGGRRRRRRAQRGGAASLPFTYCSCHRHTVSVLSCHQFAVTAHWATVGIYLGCGLWRVASGGPPLARRHLECTRHAPCSMLTSRHHSCLAWHIDRAQSAIELRVRPFEANEIVVVVHYHKATRAKHDLTPHDDRRR